MSATTATPQYDAGPRPALVGGRLRRLLRGPEADPRWARPALAGLLAVTAVLYLWNLTRNGWANDFYAAAVQAGTKSWKAFFFGSFDSSNFITVDKTPASLWVMELSARIFGFGQWSVLVPQALEGVASVALLYAAVKRQFGAAAGLIAGLVLALTPVAVLLSVAPLVDEQDAEFVRWLGADVPEAAERAILEGDDSGAVQRSVDRALEVWDSVTRRARDAGLEVPLGVNVEQLSVRHLADARAFLSAFATRFGT